MPQIFHPSMNAVARGTIFGAAIIAAAIGWAGWVYYQSAYQTQVGVVRPQPVEFSHEHHVAGLGIDCRYCHTSVETSPFAGLPATEICMQCHSQIWNESPKLEPVRASFRSGESLAWTRVHSLPDFVRFDHSIHVQRGVGCVSCHGRVDTMPLMWRTESLHMSWCVNCHRNPEPHIRPPGLVFSMAPLNETALASSNPHAGRLARETDCSICHQ
jgi:hypothetical protein